MADADIVFLLIILLIHFLMEIPSSWYISALGLSM